MRAILNRLGLRSMRRFAAFGRWPELWSTAGKSLALPALVGLIAGLGAAVFQAASQVVLFFTLTQIAGYQPAAPAGEAALFPEAESAIAIWLIVAVMTAGGLASGLLVYGFAPEAEGHGTDAVIEAYHFRRGYIRPRIPLVKMLASAITLGTGGSGGREGPIAQIGAGFGSTLATALRLPARERRILLACGMGAGVGSIFRAPLAGALFAGEILYSDAEIESEVIVPAAIASIVGYSAFSATLPAEYRFVPLFGDRLEYAIGSLVELLPLAGLALVLVAAGIVYVKTFYGLNRWFARLPIAAALRPALGAALAGLCGVGLYRAFGNDPLTLGVLSTGYGTLQAALDDPQALGAALLAGVAVVKILTTSLTIGSGGSGGVFGPSLVIGGSLGAAAGKWGHAQWPALVPHPGVCAIVGMAGFFAGCAHAPISTIIMVSEMTGDYRLLVPTMWVSTLCFVLCRRWKIYSKQVSSRLDSPAHRGDFLVDILEAVRVGDVPWKERQAVRDATPLGEILEQLPATRQKYFPVVDQTGRLVGVFTTADVRRRLDDDTLWQLALARDVMTERLVTLTPADDLNTALRRFTECNLDELPVVSAERPGELLGMLCRKDAIAVYNRRLLELKTQHAKHA